MADRYGDAAVRHLKSAETLEHAGMLDDAGYHYGVSGENTMKHALRSAGLTSHLNALANNNPLGKHYPTLGALVVQASTLIKTKATGRHAAPLRKVVDSAGFGARFSGWKISIRYADTSCCPVPALQVAAWKADAEYLARELLV